MIAFLMFNQTARMARGFEYGDQLVLSCLRFVTSAHPDEGTEGEERALREVWEMANHDRRQNGRTERSACVGDVIIVGDNAYSIEGVGFRRIALTFERAQVKAAPPVYPLRGGWKG